MTDFYTQQAKIGANCCPCGRNMGQHLPHKRSDGRTVYFCSNAELADWLQMMGPTETAAAVPRPTLSIVASASQDEEPPQPEDPPAPSGPEDYGMQAASQHQAEPPAGIQPFETFDASQWEGVPIEPRRWIAHDRIPVGEPGIMSGDGGTGKTKLALQLAVAIPAGLRDWIGCVVDVKGPVIVFSAEEKLKEMHRRTLDIIVHRGLSFKDLSGGLHFICDEGNPVLGAIDPRTGIVQPTTSLLRLEKTVAAIRPALVIIENAADVYGGNESDRTSVTRFMRGLLGRLTVPCESTVMLIQHPSVSGLSDGTGRSGSTGWNNAGRWRLNFTKIKDSDDNLRQLEIAKNNYGPSGEKIALRWERGVFVPENGSLPSPHRAAHDAQVDEKFLNLLDKATAQGRSVGPNSGPSYAPAKFGDDPDAAGIKPKAFAAAMDRLFKAGKISKGVNRRGSTIIERAKP